MFSLFKKKSTPETAAAEPTFKTRVAQFWEWYASQAARFYQAIEDKKLAELAPEINAKIHELLPGFAWVFGPGENDQGHSLTLSGEGVLHRQLLTAFCVAQAPKLPGWTFYSARQPSANPGKFRLSLGEHEFDATALWLTPLVDTEHECIHLTIWHPLFPKLDDRTRWTVIYLLLDEALGEIGTQNWIGRIEMNDSKLNGAIPLGELRSYAERINLEHAWKKGGPGECWAIYQFDQQYPGRPRGDIFLVRTCAQSLIDDFAEAQGQLSDPLAKTGADYVYVAFDVRILPKGKEADSRGEIEDALDQALSSNGRGRVLGGAMGKESAYIDLLIYDGAASVELILKTLREKRLPKGTSLNYFAQEKRGQRIVL